MSLVAFRTRLLTAISEHFPLAEVAVQEKRAVTLQVRASIDEGFFPEVYYNDLTGKTSYTLIHNGQRAFGYDNYRFWHYHPFGRVAEHIACQEPDVEAVVVEASEVVDQLKPHSGGSA